MFRGGLVLIAVALGCRTSAPAPLPEPSPAALPQASPVPPTPSTLTLRLRNGQVLENVVILHFGSDVIRLRCTIDETEVEVEYPREYFVDPRYYQPKQR